jgi:ABC-type Na+ efflux pump permease subunit
MNSIFPHTYFLACALVLASGGLAMTAAILAGDYAAMNKLLDVYLNVFAAGVVSLVGFAVRRND